jgi:hypothetical protein
MVSVDLLLVVGMLLDVLSDLFIDGPIGLSVTFGKLLFAGNPSDVRL